MAVALVSRLVAGSAPAFRLARAPVNVLLVSTVLLFPASSPKEALGQPMVLPD
jgi:hypothetical protein